METDNIYTISVKAHLDPSWSEHLQGLKILPLSDGTSELSGEVRDQAALHGVLAQIRDMGLVLLAVQKVERSEGTESHS